MWQTVWIPTIIAVIALFTSIISLYWTRIEIIRNGRPYVWAASYGFIDSEQKIIIPIPARFAFRIKNNPAKILNIDIEIKLINNILLTHKIENIFRFPDETSEWTFTLSQFQFDEIMNRSDIDKRTLTRTISIKYSCLGGKKIYKYKLEQIFEPLDNQWKDINEIAK